MLLARAWRQTGDVLCGDAASYGPMFVSKVGTGLDQNLSFCPRYRSAIEFGADGVRISTSHSGLPSSPTAGGE